jgi:hypothetical protein
MVLLFSPFLAIWILYWLYQEKLLKNIKLYVDFLKSGFLCLALVAFCTLPMLVETKLVQLDSMFSNYYTWSAHFVSLRQLFISSFWGSGGSIWGPNDGMPFMVGYLHWLIPLFILIYLIYKKKFKGNFQIFFLMIIFALISLFLTHERSTFVWQIFSPIQKIQFPWRFLNLSAFFLSFAVGIVPLLFIKNKKNYRYITFILIFLLLCFNLKYFKPIQSGPMTDSQKFSGEAWRLQVTASIYDYLPQTASTAAKAPAKEYIDLVKPSATVYTLSGQKKGSDWMFFNINLDRRCLVTLAQLYFPEFEILDNGQKK